MSDLPPGMVKVIWLAEAVLATSRLTQAIFIDFTCSFTIMTELYSHIVTVCILLMGLKDEGKFILTEMLQMQAHSF